MYTYSYFRERYIVFIINTIEMGKRFQFKKLLIYETDRVSKGVFVVQEVFRANMNRHPVSFVGVGGVCMDEYVIKQKIQTALSEPRAPEGLIQQVILRAKAVVMGVSAQKQLETATAEDVAGLVSCVLVGQLAAATQLPDGAQPEQLAQQLEQQPAIRAALHGGNLSQRLNSGELLRQITGQTSEAEPAEIEISTPKKVDPSMS